MTLEIRYDYIVLCILSAAYECLLSFLTAKFLIDLLSSRVEPPSVNVAEKR